MSVIRINLEELYDDYDFAVTATRRRGGGNE